MKKIKAILIMVLSVFLLSSCMTLRNPSESNPKESPDGESEGKEKGTYRQISATEAAALMKTETGYIILDVRRPDEYAEGRIPGAINVPNETIGTEEISALPDKAQLILVYCRSGRRSKEAAEKLVKLGYTNVVEFGGILDWTGEIVK